jgi:DNA-binding transcriptional regulator GbsR (MarR family)
VSLEAVMKLSPVMERYILHWGEMGARWGVNRSIAQIHALLFLSPRPLTAEEISDTLTIARSNVSTSLKELQSLNLAAVTHVMGDRRDHFEAEKDAWQIAFRVIEARKRREIDPTLTMLRQCLIDARSEGGEDPEVVDRLEDMVEFVQAANTWYEDVRRLPQPILVKLLKLGAKVARLIPSRSSQS